MRIAFVTKEQCCLSVFRLDCQLVLSVQYAGKNNGVAVYGVVAIGEPLPIAVCAVFVQHQGCFIVPVTVPCTHNGAASTAAGN